VHGAAAAAQLLATRVAEHRQRLAGVHRAPARRQVHGGGADRAADGQRRGGGRQREHVVAGEVGHLAVRALARRADRVVARGAAGDQLHNRRVAAAAPAAHPGRSRRRVRDPRGAGGQAGGTAHVRAAGAGARQLVVARPTEGVEAR